jgi:hypothetical protein
MGIGAAYFKSVLLHHSNPEQGRNSDSHAVVSRTRSICCPGGLSLSAAVRVNRADVIELIAVGSLLSGLTAIELKKNLVEAAAREEIASHGL